MGEAALLDTRCTTRIWGIVLASLLMGAVIWTAQSWLISAEAGGWNQIVGLATLVTLGLVTYASAGSLLGAFSLGDLKKVVRRQR